MAGTLVHDRDGDGAAQRLRRTLALFAVIGLAIALLVWRLAVMQLDQGAYFGRLADQNQLRTIPMEAPRGLMYDRHGFVIARNRPSFVVQVVPMQLVDARGEVDAIARLLGMHSEDLWRRLLRQNGVTYPDFRTLAAAVPLGPIDIAEDLTPANVAKLSERSDRFPGVSVQLLPVREYPHHALGSHFLGYVGQITEPEYRERKASGYGRNDIVGKDGLEATYDRWLRGRSGGRQIKVNSSGEAVATVGELRAVPGNDLQLSIDWHLQEAAESAVSAQIRVLSKSIGHPIGAAAIVMDPNSGELLALVSKPNIDPNDFSAGIASKKYDAYLSDPLRSLFNRAISGAYPTGSTFKLVTASAALASGMMTAGSTRYCGGAFDLNGYVFYDDRAGGHGSLSLPQAITESCDVFFYQVGHQLGIDRIDKYAAAYGIGKLTGIDLPGETTGTLPSPAWKKRVFKDEWYSGDTVSVSIGQGYLEASPLQMLDVVAAIANGGTLYRPHLVTAIKDGHGKTLHSVPPAVAGRIPLSTEALGIIRQGMLGVIESGYGTAHNVYIPGFHYAGKTGTVENVPTQDNPSGRNHAWFICYAPFEHPKIALAVFMEKSGGFGAVNAAPVAQAIVQSYLHIKTGGPNGSGIRD
ncbi:MAG: penicillin-binding protein 2 [Candidatus Eremiobacter antarcticus]|nr:penicillin-binding protein 2 [Candidatus Eremiobacteraeota bacterium]MBC5808192.1 penicillin-binding protein 2 [Candidatus Eremiobacteraeota bacterium]PZR63584.1 MAG: penicillin-binding protein 2 [Candidatus Eremiobacter sp. RRmetagenome_bin22]